ncbi:MAG: hypothetical protein IJZ79_04985 [Bacilli bacterium]|nr:hypothetical protein [Bacilli bacterium]
MKKISNNINYKKKMLIESINTLLKNEIDIKEENIKRREKEIKYNKEKIKTSIIILSLFTLLTGGVLKKIKDDSRIITYRTDKEIYTSFNKDRIIISDYQEKLSDENKITIKEYYPWEEKNNNYQRKIRTYKLSNIDYNEIISSLDEDIKLLLTDYHYYEEIEIKYERGYLREYLDNYYKIIKISQEESDIKIDYDNNKRLLLCSLFIFLEYLLYTVYIEFKEESLLDTIISNAYGIFENNYQNKEDLIQIKKYLEELNKLSEKEKLNIDELINIYQIYQNEINNFENKKNKKLKLSL